MKDMELSGGPRQNLLITSVAPLGCYTVPHAVLVRPLYAVLDVQAYRLMLHGLIVRLMLTMRPCNITQHQVLQHSLCVPPSSKQPMLILLRSF